MGDKGLAINKNRYSMQVTIKIVEIYFVTKSVIQKSTTISEGLSREKRSNQNHKLPPGQIHGGGKFTRQKITL